jgi:3'(2'), 5'-bisphosphate nucleotidase
MAGYPAFATSMALVVDGRAVAGFVADLASARRWWARSGGGAQRDGVPIRVRRGMLAGIPSPAAATRALPDVASLARYRIAGASAIDLVHVADGTLAAFASLDRTVVHVHDLAAAFSIITEAGGVVRTPDGTEPRLVPDPAITLRFVAAADAALAEAILAANS